MSDDLAHRRTLRHVRPKSSEEKLREAIEQADERLRRAEQDARELITVADGYEEAGLVIYAQRARCVARDLLRAARELRAERSVRESIQNERDRLRVMLSTRGTA